MKLEFTALFMFCGLGAGARGFLDAKVSLLGREVVFRSLGGIDIDKAACKDFEYLTKSPALCADIAKMQPSELRALAGKKAPDVVFMSPPCKGFSGLLSEEKSKTDKYQELNQLAVKCMELLLATWSTPPKLILLENVPRIETRGKSLLNKLKKVLNTSGYVCHGSTHDCGELGGLAQRRKRFFLVARHTKQVSSLLYQPIKKRVRGIGEVIGAMPMPGDLKAGPMHQLPKISWLTWIRLALIPAGGDWRDLPKDFCIKSAYPTAYRIVAWDEPTNTITTNTAAPGGGTFSVADPRAKEWFKGILGVKAWDSSSDTVTGRANPTTGPFSIADPRLTCTLRAGAYKVVKWDDPAGTITGALSIDNGPAAVADARFTNLYNVIDWESPAKTITGAQHCSNGALSIADPRKPLHTIPVIIASDGSWHRPLTPLELAALQGIPSVIDGKPLQLTGTQHGWRERIGNAVPVHTAEAIARQILLTLAHSSAGQFVLSGDGSVWVEGNQHDAH